jgi:uncharacterized protein
VLKEELMRTILTVLALAALAAPAAAQTQIVESKYDKAPWWMDQPVIASTGFIERELPSNRAFFTASFQVVERTAAEATKAAADKVRELGQALTQPGPEKVRVQTNFSIRPIYEQYRDKEGNRIENQRSDKIERYEVNAILTIEVRDLGLLERVYSAVMVTKPTSTSGVNFSLDAGNEVKTDLARAAVADANRRARLSTEAAGARLGPVKLIDPTGRACQTDVLVARAPRGYGPGVESFVEDVVVTGSRSMPAPPPPPPRQARAPSAQDIMSGNPLPADQQPLPLQPPTQRLQAQACVVYALAG